MAEGPGAVFDDATGMLVSSFDAEPPPAVGDQHGIFVNGGIVSSIDQATGAAIWTFTRTGDQIVSAPIEVNGAVFVGSNEGVVYALDANTGTMIWSGDTTVRTTVRPFGAGEGILVVPTDNRLTTWTLQ